MDTLLSQLKGQGSPFASHQSQAHVEKLLDTIHLLSQATVIVAQRLQRPILNSSTPTNPTTNPTKPLSSRTPKKPTKSVPQPTAPPSKPPPLTPQSSPPSSKKKDKPTTSHPKLPLQWVPRSPNYYNSPFTFTSTPVRAITHLTHLSPSITNNPSPTLDPALDPTKSSAPKSNPVPVPTHVALTDLTPSPDLAPPPDTDPFLRSVNQPKTDPKSARLAAYRAKKKEKFKLRRAARLAANPQPSPPTLTSNPTTTNPQPSPPILTSNPTTNHQSPPTHTDDEAPANDIVNFPHTYDLCPALPTCPAHRARFEVYLESYIKKKSNPPPDPLLSQTTGSGVLMSDGMWHPDDGSPYPINVDLPSLMY